MFNIFLVVFQFETELRAERQMDGINKAKQREVTFGRKKKLSKNQIFELQQRRAKGELIRDLMHEHKLSKASVYRYLGVSNAIKL